MHSPRAQADKKAYQIEVKRRIEHCPNIDLRQELVEDLLTESIDDRSRICGVQVHGDAIYVAKAVILTTGTFLQAIMHTGEAKTAGGRAGRGHRPASAARFDDSASASTASRPAHHQDSMVAPSTTRKPPNNLGMTLQSFFVHDRSYRTTSDTLRDTYTNEAVHELIRANLHRAPMYSGQIQSRGPRYCPSIEDKVVRFADKDQHQLFLEPEGRNTLEVYVNGISTSLPRDVQDQMFRLIPGLENAQILRYGYAVEYDYALPIISSTLGLKPRRSTVCTSLVKSMAPQVMKKLRPRLGRWSQCRLETGRKGTVHVKPRCGLLHRCVGRRSCHAQCRRTVSNVYQPG